MLLESGRLEKRTRLAVPVEIVGIDEDGAAASAITENVCSRGLRVVARRPLRPREPLLISSPPGDRPVPVRVVYCERVSNGRFAAGLKLESKNVRWVSERLVNFGS